MLDEKQAIITKIVIFRIDKQSTSVCKNGLDTSKIIEIMIIFSLNLFHLELIITNYSCDISNMTCGKVIISPIGYKSQLTKLRFDSRVKPLETFIVEVSYNSDNNKIYKCQMCGVIT